MAKKLKLSPLAKRVLNVFLGLLIVGLYLKKKLDAPDDPSPTDIQGESDIRSAQEAAVKPPSKPGGSASINDPSAIRVGTWNLEWLGTPDRRRGSKESGRSQAELELIAETIDTKLELDVVVLNEINLQSPQWKALSKALGKRGFRTYSPSPRADQETAIAYRSSRIKTTGATRALDNGDIRVGPCRSGVRRPIVASLRAGEFDFTVIGVHFRSQRPSECGGDDFPEEVREQEVKRILAEIAKGQRKGKIDKDVIITGDFNVESSDPSLRAFTKEGLTFVTHPDNLSEESGEVSYRKSRHEGALDHIIISVGATNEYIEASAQHHAMFSTLNRQALDKYRLTFSDHAPTWASFSTHLEDDD